MKVLKDNPDATKGLNTEQFLSSIKDLQGTVQGDTGTRSSRFNYTTGVQDYQDNQKATELINSFRHLGLTKEDFGTLFEQKRADLIKQGYSPGAIEKARSALTGESPDDASFGGGHVGQ